MLKGIELFEISFLILFFTIDLAASNLHSRWFCESSYSKIWFSLFKIMKDGHLFNVLMFYIQYIYIFFELFFLLDKRLNLLSKFYFFNSFIFYEIILFFNIFLTIKFLYHFLIHLYLFLYLIYYYFHCYYKKIIIDVSVLKFILLNLVHFAIFVCGFF